MNAKASDLPIEQPTRFETVIESAARGHFYLAENGDISTLV